MQPWEIAHQPFIGIDAVKVDPLDAGGGAGIDPAVLDLKGLAVAVMDGAQMDQFGPLRQGHARGHICRDQAEFLRHDPVIIA